VVLVRGGDHPQDFALRPLREPELRGVGKRLGEERPDPRDTVGGERKRFGRGRAPLADGTAGARGIADERVPCGATLGAGSDVRQVARQPEQLELESEPERVEGRPLGGVRRGVEEVEKAGECRNARSFASSSLNRRSIASAPIIPTENR